MLIFTITLIMAGVLCVMALWLDPMWLAAFNCAAITMLVVMATTMVFPRFDITDTMRPWEPVLAQLVPDDQTVVMYKPARWVEYGLQYYLNNRVRGVFSTEELTAAIRTEPRI